MLKRCLLGGVRQAPIAWRDRSARRGGGGAAAVGGWARKAGVPQPVRQQAHGWEQPRVPAAGQSDSSSSGGGDVASAAPVIGETLGRQACFRLLQSQVFVDLPFHAEAQLHCFELSRTEAPKLPSQTATSASAQGGLTGQLPQQSPSAVAVPVPVPAGGDPTVPQVPPRQPGGQLLRAEEAVVAFKSRGGGISESLFRTVWIIFCV